MIIKRASAERGHFNHGWLKTYHTFSFADYYDPEHMGFKSLRVINEDFVEPARGFGTHPHQNMEIITYILEGRLEHKDSMGNGSIITPGEVQRMSAGTGVTHSEFNPSPDQAVHLLQIWILPNAIGSPPGYEQKRYPIRQDKNRLHLIASADGRRGSVTIQQDAAIHACVLEAGKALSHALPSGRSAWVQVASGSLNLNAVELAAGDGARVENEAELALKAGKDSEFLVFEL